MKFLPTWRGIRNTIGQVIMFCFLGFVIWDIPSSSGWTAIVKGLFMLAVLGAICGLELEKWEEG